MHIWSTLQWIEFLSLSRAIENIFQNLITIMTISAFVLTICINVRAKTDSMHPRSKNLHFYFFAE